MGCRWDPMNANFARWCRVWLGVVLLAGAGVARGDWPVLPEDMQQRVISLKEETPVVRAVRENLAAALAMTIEPGAPLSCRRANACWPLVTTICAGSSAMRMSTVLDGANVATQGIASTPPAESVATPDGSVPSKRPRAPLPFACTENARPDV